jgi:hypothetical protein
VATWDEVGRIALALPETSERVSRGLRQWRVTSKGFVWERPLRRADVEALGDEAPDGPIVGAWVEHLGAKQALLADNPGVFFTTPHFDGYPAILVCLDRIPPEDLDEVIVEAWLARAPKRLAKAYVDACTRRRGLKGQSSPPHRTRTPAVSVARIAIPPKGGRRTIRR